MRTSHAVQLIAGTGAVTALSLAYVVLVARALTPEAYGEFAAGLAVIYLIGTASSPVTPTVAHFIALYRARGDEAGVMRFHIAAEGVLLKVCLAAAVVAIPLALVGRELLGFRSVGALFASCAAGILTPIALLHRGVLQGTAQFYRFNLNAVAEAAVRLLFGAALLLAFARTVSLALAPYALALAVAILMLRTGARHSANAAAVDWLAVGHYLGATSILMATYAVFQNLDVLAAQRWLGPEAAGHYGAAAALARSMTIMAWPLNALSVPTITALAQSGQPVLRAFTRLLLLFAVLAVPAVVLCAAFPQFIVTFLYGVQFTPAAPIVAPLVAATAATTLNLVIATALAALRRFAFLSVYVGAAVVQGVCFSLFHSSARDLVLTIVIVQLPLTLVLATFFWRASAQVRR